MAKDRIDLQNDEFEAVSELSKQFNRTINTAVVDDDYPEVRHGYECAVRQAMTAFHANKRRVEDSTPTANYERVIVNPTRNELHDAYEWLRLAGLEGNVHAMALLGRVTIIEAKLKEFARNIVGKPKS